MNLLGNDAVLASNALSGKTALICGASRGIGAATARIMAAAGANVIVSARNQDQLDHLVEELNALGNGNHQTLVMDLEDTKGISDKINPVLEQNPIHILVNNAAGPPGGPLLDSTVEELTQPFARHLHAAHTLVRLLVPTMESEGYLSLIHI